MPTRNPHHKHHPTPSISPSSSSLPTPIPQPNFSTQCHYTKLIYLCTHYTFTTKPFVINHVSPCPHHLTNRGRCNNMASVPYEKAVGEMCSECRPVSLGVQAHLRSFEVLGGGDGRRGEEGGEGEGDKGERDWGVEGEEIKKDLKTLEEAFRGLDIKDTIEAGNAARDKRKKVEDEGTKDAKLWKEKGEWVDVKTRQETLTPPPAEKEEKPAIEIKPPAAKKEEQPATGITPAPTTKTTDTETKSSFLTSLLKIFKPDSSHPSPPTTTTSSQSQTKPESENAEPWVSISQDPDWENVTQEEKKEVDRKLWKDKGEWIKVNTNTKQET